MFIYINAIELKWVKQQLVFFSLIYSLLLKYYNKVPGTGDLVYISQFFFCSFVCLPVYLFDPLLIIPALSQELLYKHSCNKLGDK